MIKSPFRIAVLFTCALLVSTPFTHTELRLINPTGAPDPMFDLAQGWGYLLLAPFCNVLDTLTLLSPSQHLELWGGIALTWIALSWVRRLSAPVRSPVDWAGALRLSAATGLTIVVIYLVGGLVPRPMEAITVKDPDLVRVDFHNHTRASHDARPFFDAEDLRAWHHDAGFDAAYISDHGGWEGVDSAQKNNPAHAGEGTVLLEAREFRLGGAHVIGLGDRALYDFAMNDGAFDARAATRRYGATGTWPVMIFTIPGKLSDLSDYATSGLAPYAALEVSDGAPLGLEQGWRDRTALENLSKRYDLALVSSSNHHGWGRTASAWTLMSVPGWRQMSPRALGEALQQGLAVDGRRAAMVVERLPPAPAGAWYGAALVAPELALYLLTTLTVPERLIWLFYVWVGAGLLAPKVRLALGGALEPP